MELGSTDNSRSSSASASPNRSSVRRSRPCSDCAVERAFRRSLRRDARSRSGVAASWIASSTDSAGMWRRRLAATPSAPTPASAPGSTTMRVGSDAPTGSTSTCEAPCARFQSAVALEPGPAAHTGMPSGALAVRVVRVVMRVCMRAASDERKGVSRSASAAGCSRAMTVKLVMGVGRLWMRRALTVTCWPTDSGFSRWSGKLREASSSQLRPSVPSRSGVAGTVPSIDMRTRSRSVAPANWTSCTTPVPTRVSPGAGGPAVSSISSGRITATISRGVTASAPGRSKRRLLPRR